MAKVKYSLFIFSFNILASCTFDELTVSNLGSMDTFDDVKIEDDFEAPEEEKEEVIVDTPTTESPKNSPLSSFVNTFFIENQSFSLARGPAKRWDGCQANYKSTGGYNSDVKCGRAFIEEKFGKKLNQIFYKCVFNSAESSGYTKIQKVFINHLGSYNDRTARNSTRLSNHAFARALDIKNFNLVNTSGTNFKISTLLRDYTGSQAKFYDSFRQCWKESMPSSCKPGQSEYTGSIGHTSSKLGGNSLHNDHIHLSFPLCAG